MEIDFHMKGTKMANSPENEYTFIRQPNEIELSLDM